MVHEKSQFQETHSSKWGSNPWQWDGTYAAVLLGSQFTPTQCFKTLYLDLPITNAEKPLITQKVLVTQSCNIVHCNWHTQKPIRADLQVFVNILSLWELMFFQFFVRGSSGNGQNFTFGWFWLGTMHWNGLSGAYLRLEVCQIQYHRFWVSVISGS